MKDFGLNETSPNSQYVLRRDPDALRVDAAKNPTNIRAARPRLAHPLLGGLRAEMQLAYILLRSTR